MPLYVTLVSTGTWRGEARGLSGGIAWDAQHIRVRRSLYKGGYYLPKSKESRQRIDVGDQVLGSLRGVERVDYRDGELPAAPWFTTPSGTSPTQTVSETT